MSQTILADNTSIKIAKKAVSSNVVVNNAWTTVISTTATEYCDLYAITTAYVSGPGGQITLELYDNDTGQVYWTQASTTTSPYSASSSTDVPIARMTPNSVLRVIYTALNNANTWNFKIRGLTFVNTP